MDAQPQAAEPTLQVLITHISHLLRGGGAISVGDAAALRRMDPRHPAAAFFKIEGLVLDEHLPGDAATRADVETRWAAVITGMAFLGDLHQPARRLGLSLADAGYSELRFARLIRADADRLVDELPGLARFLVAKRIPVDWTAAAHLILSAGGRNEEPIRRHLARDYYGSLSRQEGR